VRAANSQLLTKAKINDHCFLLWITSTGTGGFSRQIGARPTVRIGDR
jgi:hypothetical protein